MADKIVPCLWFDGEAEAATAFYVSLLPDSRITAVNHSPVDTPSGPAGSVLTVQFVLAGREYLALNGGPNFRFTEAVSFMVMTEDQAETDRLWDALTADGGRENACGWLKDRWGLSWQITPRRLVELTTDPDPARAKAAMQAMMEMIKIDVAALERAVADL
ncbi:VOC family protein [Brevundimonas aurantiaca]|jgi:predicted 3-demethylubiquinone-9 3-methyltransferase (glyoxalase superfamily)|uniref:Putative 3-demethylubiquinone-9 3-methyltransferase (Glyoxalase superfamily) n=1 Tax=Brevundimonas aurantiaca TaxID=74316 RepID=A0A7W9C9J5_9CAUL|nr:VOC family protein [Brevundimonas aurantiaca]MBB5741197.1 putative 3-demethylubiquinone-9 3-methyltransferase (glyoxalase superfamily) [Brevundimonas aurantiaca]